MGFAEFFCGLMGDGYGFWFKFLIFFFILKIKIYLNFCGILNPSLHGVANFQESLKCDFLHMALKILFF